MNGWKVIAIIFIIISMILAGTLTTLLYVGFSELSKEERCAMDTCMDYSSYLYDGIYCECYENGELALREYVN